MNNTEKTRFNSRMRFLNIPKRYTMAHMNDYGPHMSVQLKGISHITGLAGRGKTHLLYALAKQAVLDSIGKETIFTKYKRMEHDTTTATHVSITELLANIKSTFSHETEETEEDVIRMYCITQNLYIDDFGTHLNTDWEFTSIFRILDYRWANVLNTVVASNLSIPEIAERQSTRIASRIMGMGGSICLQQKDRRINEN